MNHTPPPFYIGIPSVSTTEVAAGSLCIYGDRKHDVWDRAKAIIATAEAE